MTLIYIRKIGEIISVHDEVLRLSGGLQGTKNIEILESVIAQIQNDLYYPELEHKLTHLVFSVNKFHAFQDGNKRTSIAVGALFLERNGFDYIVPKFIQEMENIAVCVADNVIDKDMLNEIIYSIIYEDDYDEDLKLRIAISISLSKDLTTNNNEMEDNSLF
ncbi:Fic/DOC family protein [Chryseobacterium sp. MOF25P]|uniref:type II toxin-antitoxin system death-on-curing family toxin n=1 Tax=unclassified Chryseobacterium TaxID=2593645 RepID=UPI000804DEA2|nr:MULTISPECIES: type II toxin-antitoxin system death-on-curing family toxin [unclassified Chryseobacterium]OBW42300.1 Fic/DOC family protein [Chryseobacterium sp. MOF25P]OBW46787.1 Fic/DOC family protein [Chryseobacterium sp. BGARF1]